MDKESLERMIAAARTAGAEGIFLVRGAHAAALAVTFDGTGMQSLQFAPPHEVLVLIRFPRGDGGEAGIESRD